MDSRLLTTLNAQASSTRDPVLWAETVCRAAAHFARHGKTPEALKAISVVRAHYGTELHHEVASWLMLAEGILHFFQTRTYEAYDRIRRAYGLAVALETESALPVCAAWMAHVEFHDCQYDKMVFHIEEALVHAKPNDHPAHARASLVLANAYHLAGEYPLARPWYEKARLRAADDGDNATLSAMLYNVAAFRASNVRLDDAFGIENLKESHRASMEVSSSYIYDFAIGTEGLGFLTQMLRGVLLTIERKYAEAFEMLSGIDRTKIQKQMFSPLFADMSWCCANLDRTIEALEFSTFATQHSVDCLEADDIAYVEARLSQVAARCNLPEEANLHLTAATAALHRHREFQVGLLAKLRTINLSKKNPA